MPVKHDTPETANNEQEEKALLVAELLLAEEVGDLTPVIIANANASVDLAKKIADLTTSGAQPLRSGATSIAPPKPIDLSVFDSPGHEIDKRPIVPAPLPEGAPGAGTAGNPFPLPPPPNPFPPFGEQSSTPAFGKPQPVIVVGPRPLPVTVIGPIEESSKKDLPEKERKGPDIATILSNSLVGVLRGVLSGNFTQAGSAIAQGAGKATEGAALAAGAEAGPAAAAGVAVAVVAEKLASIITGPADAIARKFEAVIGPAAIMAASLNSATAGFQVVAKVTTLIGATLGSIFLPITLALAVAMLQAARIISSVLEPSLEDWFGTIDQMIPLFLFLGVVVAQFGVVVTRVASGMLQALEILNKANPFTDALDPLIIWVNKLGDGIGALRDGLIEGTGKAIGEPRGPGARGAVGGDIATVLAEFKRSFSPQAAFTGIADVGKQIQLAALNKSPIDALILKEIIKISGIAERAIGRPGPAVAPIGPRGGVAPRAGDGAGAGAGAGAGGP